MTGAPRRVSYYFSGKPLFNMARGKGANSTRATRNLDGGVKQGAALGAINRPIIPYMDILALHASSCTSIVHPNTSQSWELKLKQRLLTPVS